MADNRKQKKYTPEIQIGEYGKLPPQAVELEEAVLGALMLEKNAVLEVLDVLKPDSFYKEAHQKIYEVIRNLSSNEQPIDGLTVIEELRKKEQLDSVGGPAFIWGLTSKVAAAAHIEYHARIIQQKYIQRELIRISSEIQTKAFDDSQDVLDLLNFSESSLFDLAEGNIKTETSRIRPLIDEAIKHIEEAGKREDGLSGVPSGFTGIDRITSGWQPSDLIIIAARPSMGKTAFVLSMARNMAVQNNVPVAVFSLEMSSLQLVTRLIVSETELPVEKIRTGKLQSYEWQQLDYKIKELHEAPIYIDDTPAISIFELRAKCRRLVRQHNIRAVVIDYLQLMSAGSDNKMGTREQEVSTISRSLKSIAKELNIPIIALSQLNRSVESRAGLKRPVLSDLRESGAIEQDADMVLFIHRPEYYGFTEDENQQSLIGIAEIIIAKHRNGALGDVRLKFISNMAKFAELDVVLGDIPEASYSNGKTLSSKMNNSSFSKSNDSFDSNVEFDKTPPSDPF